MKFVLNRDRGGSPDFARADCTQSRYHATFEDCGGECRQVMLFEQGREQIFQVHRLSGRRLLVARQSFGGRGQARDYEG
jgi:hypothetical protein